MFMLRNVGKYLFGDTSKESIIDIPQGQLYLVRPLSPKGYSELIFKDAAASIRRTAQEFQYQLIVQRAYEEGEEELLEDEEDEDGVEGALAAEKDEKTFLLDESLHFRSETRHGGEKVFAWKDLSGDLGDHYEFVCDRSVQPVALGTFELVAIQCQYERKYRRSHQKATEEELRQFSFSDALLPEPEPEEKSALVTASSSSSSKPVKSEMSPRTSRTVKEEGESAKEVRTMPPPSAKHPEQREMLVKEKAELHLYDFNSGTFILQDPEVTAFVSETGAWKYWLQITGKEKDWLGQPIVADINPVFNFDYLSFIFNHYTADGSAYSWLLRFRDQTTVERFQEGLMRALWESLNQMKWIKAKDDDREYVLEAFQDLTMEDAPEYLQDEEEEEEDEKNAEDEEEEEEEYDGQRSEHYDSDESEDDVTTRDNDGNVNSQLAVGYKHDRSFVVRGSKIGVFKHTPNNNLEFSTNISKVETPGGKLFSPKKVMLHAEDSNMILQNEQDPHSLYKMDLEYGKVVDEWKVHDDIPVDLFAPEKKFSQMTGEQTFLGLSRNALYRIDPRLAGNKLVDSELKQYVSKNDFSAAATTEQGYIAVASNKGDIRMFDRLGINAKTHIPALGEAIIGLDVSADGRWVLATCRTYLLLVDALQKEGKHVGKLGFERSFGKDSKPQPRRLGLQPAHVAQFQHETGAALAFTPARFNTGVDSNETSIITATGPFIVTWNLKKVLQGRKDPYTIKRYAEEVKADNFKFGSDRDVIVALPNEVNMVAKRTFKRPTRESIASPVEVGGGGGGYGGGRGSGVGGRRSEGRNTRGGSRLSRNEIVDSPY
ncbi:MAG: Trehalose-6-P synthase/phosphatase complex synthase subunit [Watsoniomyces obsoletus]|nr:MAG: Trehalose-6-P synthase/phosphatase complex synthase subunit [Watsoniomyces obsoletus]